MKNESKRTQMNKFFLDLGGVSIAEIDGTNESELKFWNVNGKLIISQYWGEPDGWTSFIESNADIISNGGNDKTEGATKAWAIQIENRWFYKFGKHGQILTAWSLAGARLLQTHEVDEIYNGLEKKGKQPTVRLIGVEE